MDVIDEEGGFGDFDDQRGWSRESLYGTESLHDESMRSVNSENTADISDSETEFAKVLRKHRREVMQEGGAKKKESFSQRLRKHRDQLVTTWQVDDPLQMSGDLTSSEFPNGGANGTSSTSSFQHSTSNTEDDGEEDNDDFGDFEDAPATESATNVSANASLDNDSTQLFDSMDLDGVSPMKNVSMDITFGDHDPFRSPEQDRSLSAQQRASYYETNNVHMNGDSDEYGVSTMSPSGVGTVTVMTNSEENPNETVMSPVSTSTNLLPLDSTTGNGDKTYDNEIPQQVPSTLSGAVDKSADFGVLNTTSTSFLDGVPREPTQSATSNRSLDDLGVPSMTQKNGDTNGIDLSLSGGANNTETEQPGEATADNDDEFGDFGDAVPATGTSSNDNGTTNGGKQALDDFGDFGSAPPTTALAMPSLSSTPGDGIGTLGTAPTLIPENDDGLETAETPDGTSSAGPVTNDADFGDFGTASSLIPVGDNDTAQPTPPTLEPMAFEKTNAEGSNTNDPSAATASEPNLLLDDAFGDFGTAPTPDTSVPALVADEFGDFGTAVSGGGITPNNDGGNGEGVPVPATIADDFGDFTASETNASALTTAPTTDGNDFGDFDSAPNNEDPKPSTDVDADVANNNDDDFGDFDGITSPPAPVDTTLASPVDGDDDFGDFGAAPADPNITPEPVQSTGDDFGKDVDTEPTDSVPVHNNSDDDDFGNFDSAPSAKEKSTSEAQNETNDNDLFGDFGNSASTAATVPAPPTTAVIADDDFGDFDAAPSGAVDSSPTPGNDNESDFGNFDSAQEQAPEPSSKVQDTANEADDFGDFEGGFSSQPVKTREMDFGNLDNTSSDSIPAPEPIPVPNGEDFGDFGSALEETTTTTSPAPAPSADTANHDDDNDDDFGDFDAAPLSESFTKMESGDVAAAAADDDDDDDFGDFDAAPSASTPVQTAATGNDDDDFGDFDTAPSAPDPKAETGDDDGFGDFGNAPAAAPAPASETQMDDFGDFDAAPPAPAPAPAPSGTDDDFGDFDAAPSAPVAQPDNNNDDDFGDFGDFDAAPAPAPVPAPSSADDDFGDFDAAPAKQDSETQQQQQKSSGPVVAEAAEQDDFGGFDSAQPEQVKSSSSHKPLAPQPPELQNARLVFSRFQSKYTFEAVDDDANKKEFPKNSTLDEYMSSMGTKGPKDHNLYIQLLAAEAIGGLSATKESSLLPSNLTIEYDGRGPFHRYVFPVGGLSVPGENKSSSTQDKSQRRVSSLQASVPDVLPIQLPTGKEMPLEASSPKPARAVTDQGNGMDENVHELELPSLKPTADKKRGSVKNRSTPKRVDNGLSAAGQQFLAKIPDLSFMLQSSLVLPKK